VVWTRISGDTSKDATLSTEQVRRGGAYELAVTGRAFDLLVRDGVMQDLVLRTRIFARMKPAGKVDVVQLLISQEPNTLIAKKKTQQKTHTRHR
jgi:magnesium-transporting ATPase (P-type)